LIAVVGIIAYRLIDNAAHLGGLFTGVIIGLICLHKYEQRIPLLTSEMSKVLGIVSRVITMIVACFILWKFFLHWI